MIQTLEASVRPDGIIQLPSGTVVPAKSRVLVTILDDSAATETLLMSEVALAQDWNDPQEDQAWENL